MPASSTWKMTAFVPAGKPSRSAKVVCAAEVEEATSKTQASRIVFRQRLDNIIISPQIRIVT